MNIDALTVDELKANSRLFRAAENSFALAVDEIYGLKMRLSNVLERAECAEEELKKRGRPEGTGKIKGGAPFKNRVIRIDDERWAHCDKQPGGRAAYIRRLIDQDMAHNSGEREKEESK